MKLQFTERFVRQYRALPGDIQEQTDRKLDLLIGNLRHPSLHAKKMHGTDHIWELRITHGYRATFEIQKGAYLLRNVGTHDILRRL